jgi:S1-C subfamily serine protease
MKNLQDATERICELKGSLVALDALVPAVVDALPRLFREDLVTAFDARAEAARTVMLHADISDLVLASFERDVARTRAVLKSAETIASPSPSPSASPIDALLLSSTRISTFVQFQPLTHASGFFFRRHGRLFLVTNRHVLDDAASSHHPDRIEIVMHTDLFDLSRFAVVSLPLYLNGLSQWREASDIGGPVDVAVIEIPAEDVPAQAVLQAFDESHLEAREELICVGDSLTIVGFPLGFYDTVHHLAVARNASVASAYGIRFQRQGYFLTDARTHRGSSGAPVVRRRSHSRPGELPAWQLLGVHSTRMDMSTRDHTQDDWLGLNCSWYADVLLTLTNG